MTKAKTKQTIVNPDKIIYPPNVKTRKDRHAFRDDLGQWCDAQGTPAAYSTINPYEEGFSLSKQRYQQRQQRKARDRAMRDLGLVKVKGALGGTYWE